MAGDGTALRGDQDRGVALLFARMTGLDADMQAIVDLVNGAAADAPSIWDQTVADRREGYQALVMAVPPGPEMASVTDASFDGPGGPVLTRIYRPTAVEGGDPGGQGVIVFYHGGGWVIGDLDTHDEVCRQLASQSGAAVVSVDYRMGPEARFPAAIDDSWAAFEWVVANRAGICGDADAKVCVSGDSAGGNLAAVVALMARDAGIDLAAQLLVYPATDMTQQGHASLVENAEGYVLTMETMRWFRAHYLSEDDDEAATQATDWRGSPLLSESLAGVAPALVITAQFDPLRDEGTAYANALAAAGVEVTHTNYEGVVHIFFQLGPIVEKAAAAVAEVATAAARALS